MNAVIYARYNNSKSVIVPSIEEQLEMCHKFAKENNITIITEYVDLAIDDSRKNFKKMINDSKKQDFQCVLVCSLDRFTTNIYESAIYKDKLRKNNVKVISIKTPNISKNASNILMESVIEGFIEYIEENKIKMENV